MTPCPQLKYWQTEELQWTLLLHAFLQWFQSSQGCVSCNKELQEVQSCLQWPNLVCLLSGCSLLSSCSTALWLVLLWIWVFLWVCTVGNWSDSRKEKCFSWASVKSLYFELPAGTGGLWAYHIGRQKGLNCAPWACMGVQYMQIQE